LTQQRPTDAEISDWLTTSGVTLKRIERLPGDVSVRVYVRIVATDSRTFLLSYCPAELRDACARFLETSALLEGAGVRTPQILNSSAQEGWILLEDLGEDTLYDLELSWEALTPYYRDAARAIEKIQTLDPAEVRELSPPLDAAMLLRELEQTWELFLDPQRLAGAATTRSRLQRALSDLCQQIGTNGLVPCHRDFMARNLMPTASDRVAVIDHQDLRLGPRFYDHASLLNDSLFAPGPIVEATLSSVAPGDSDREDYSRATLQRTLKAIGTFVAFSRRGNNRHLPLIRPTLRRAADHLAQIPETAPLASELAPHWKRWDENDLLE